MVTSNDLLRSIGNFTIILDKSPIKIMANIPTARAAWHNRQSISRNMPDISKTKPNLDLLNIYKLQ